MKRFDIINLFIKKYGYKSYLEIGVQKKNSFNNVVCDKKVGVDPDSDTHATHVMTSDEYFLKYKDKFGIIFIDGLHEAEQVYKDVVNALEVLEDGGTIICHDINPKTEIEQRVPRETKRWNGDCWKAFVRLRTGRCDLDMLTVDTDEGCSIIRKGKQDKLILNSEMTYANLDKNRKEWLNLITVDEFKKSMGYVEEVSREYKIWNFIPYNVEEKDYGKACNEYCEIVPNDNDVIVINDVDCMSLTPANIHVLKNAIDKAPKDWGMLIPYVSRIGQMLQVYDVKQIENGDMRVHRNIALKLVNQPLKFMELNIPISGAVMAFTKKTWREVEGFKSGILGVDTNWSNKIRRLGKKIYLVNQLYYMHYYRLNEGMSNKSHLK